MDTNLVFIYDGQCPFCNHFAELLELKSGLSNIEFIDGRKNISKLTSLYELGYDLDKGAILIKNDQIFHGGEAINFICNQINNPSDALLEILRVVFLSNKRTKLLFPFLLWFRRSLLFLKGVKWKPVA